MTGSNPISELLGRLDQSRRSAVDAPRRVIARLVSLPQRDSLAAAHDGAPPERRELVILRVEADADSPALAGWGECSALNRATYTAETARSSWEALTSHGEVSEVDTPMLWAGWVSGQVDLALKQRGQSLAACLGVDADHTGVPAGAALGFAPLEQITAQANALAASGYQRIKLKIQPGHSDAAITAAIEGAPNVELQLDANGSFSRDEVDLLAAFAERGVTAIEQPFAPDDVASAAALVERLTDTGTVVVADEAVASLADAQRLLSAGALSGVSVKAPRVGGLHRAVEMASWCAANGVAATAGGMLESALGRHALVALAALPAFTLAGDISPAGRWLASDPWPDVALDGGMVTVPDSPGVSPEPDADLLDEYTVAFADVSGHPGLS